MAKPKEGTASTSLQASRMTRVLVRNLLPVVTGQDGYILVSQGSSDTVHDRVLSLTGSIRDELKPEIFFPLQVKVGVDNRNTLTILAMARYATLFDCECSTFRFFRRAAEPQSY